MASSPSKSAAGRQTGRHQVDQQRAAILDAAEALFLQYGLEHTSMRQIARQAGINRVTVYRYFANRDEIAVEIQLRMMLKLGSVLPPEEAAETGLERHRRWASAMIRSFDHLRDAYRYFGMFDRVYLDNAQDSALTQWAIARLNAGLQADRPPGETHDRRPHPKELPVILSTIIWFLEKLALRGELTWGDPSTPLEENLAFFEAMIMAAFDRLEADYSAPPAGEPGGETGGA